MEFCPSSLAQLLKSERERWESGGGHQGHGRASGDRDRDRDSMYHGSNNSLAFDADDYNAGAGGGGGGGNSIARYSGGSITRPSYNSKQVHFVVV
jgi:hypothetical protein